MLENHHPYWLVLISLLLALAPVVVGLFTAFIKIHVVLSFFRSGLGAQQIPSGLVILGLSIALTFSVMTPTLTACEATLASFPWKKLERSPDKIKRSDLEPIIAPWREFLEKHTGEREKRVFERLSGNRPVMSDEESAGAEVQSVSETSWSVLLPAFVVTELKEAFLIGFMLLLPFLAIDLIVANILAGVGMFMVSPVMISLPLKVALFVFADGWLLLTKGLVESYRVLGG